MSQNKHPLSPGTEYKSGRFQDVFWLQSCIMDAFRGGGYEKLREYLQHTESYVPQSHDHLLLQQLDTTMTKELHGKEFQCVSLLLKCIQRFFLDGLTEEEPLLIQQGVIPKIKTMRLLTKKDLPSDVSLITATRDFLETALIISRNSYKGRIQMLDAFVFSLGFLVTEKFLNHSIGQEALWTLNCILEIAPWTEKKKLHLLEGPRLFMKDLARTILTVGDYNQQAALSEALCRLASKASRGDLAQHWFGDGFVVEAFKEIDNRTFETDCRQFLNRLNSRLGDRRRVYSFPCISAFADGHEMRKPESEKLEDFWIDFNLGSRSVTFYVDNPKSVLWESVTILQEAVGTFCVIETETVKMLVVHFKKPVVISNKDVMKTEIHFDLQFGISYVSRKVLGGVNQAVPPANEDASESIGPLLLSEPSTSEQSAAEETGPTVVLEQSAAEEVANQEPLLTNLKHKLPTLEDLDLSDGGFVTLKKSRWEDGVSWEFQSSVREENDLAEVTSESEFSAELQETSVQVPVPGGKGISSSYSALKGQGKQDTEIPTFMSNKHLFSDTSEDSSNTSERSWTRASQPRKKFLKVYSNKKKKVAHRRMKILPLSPISSDSDLEKGQALPLTILRKDTAEQDKAWTPKVYEPTLPGPLLLSEPSTSEQSAAEEGGPTVLLEQSAAEETGPTVANQEPLLTNLKHKLPTLEDLDLSDGGFVTPKQPRWEDGVSGEFQSSVREENDLAGASSPPLEVTLKNSASPALLSTFENLTEELKKTYELRHRKSELCLKRGARAPDCLTKLLKHIHQCRLNTVQQFHRLVHQGLSRLGEELRALKHTEDDILEVWRKEYAQSFRDTHTLRDFSDTEAARTEGGAEQEQAAAAGQKGTLG